jgi:molecular chaperone GrpE
MAREGEPPETPTEEPPASGGESAGTAKGTTDSSDWESRFKYLLADFDNFRRRTERDRAANRIEAEANLLRRLIPLVEGFQNAEASGRSLPQSDPLRRGIELLGHELEGILRSVGFAPVARVGETFRHEEHEAVGEVVGPKNIPDGAVAEIVQQGYRFQGGLLRPAKVLVARAVKGTDTGATAESEPGMKDPHISAAGEGPA